MRAFLLATLLLAAPLAALCQEGGDNSNQAPTAEAPAAECDNPFDKEMQDRYSNFFLVLRLLNYYTLDDPPTPGPSLDLSQTNGMPVTVMVPTNDAMNDFLKANKLDLQGLAQNPQQVISLAPSFANHFLLGAFPAAQLQFQPAPPEFESQSQQGGGGRKLLQAPPAPGAAGAPGQPAPAQPAQPTPPQPAAAAAPPMGAVTTLCGPVCPPLAFYQATNGSQLVASGTSAAEITKPDAAMCSDQYIVHEVNNVLYVPVTDPNQATQPALSLARLLGGQFDSYNIAGAQPDLRGALGRQQQIGGGR